MHCIDEGHTYKLICLDGSFDRFLTYVKRKGPGYPYNETCFPGTNLQDVYRTTEHRIQYLQKQAWCVENVIIRWLTMICIWLLEFRACRRKGKLYLKSPAYATYSQICLDCGHTKPICQDNTIFFDDYNKK